jgi:hypothetical protein
MSYLKAKYPRTPHLPWSEGTTIDDRLLQGTTFFTNQDVVVTLKMDGENTTMMSDAIYARSPNSQAHPSRSWIKSLHSTIQYQIPRGYRFCGENMYAKHSIKYKDLPSYFLLFSVFDHLNRCLSWDETVYWAKTLGLNTVPVLYRGTFDSDLIKSLKQKEYQGNEMEGYVVRLSKDFMYDAYGQSVAKFVRANHVKTPDHWMHQNIEKNGVSDDKA